MPLLNLPSLQETGALSPPSLRQDPLVLQLRDEPETFKEENYIEKTDKTNISNNAIEDEDKCSNL